MLSQAKQAILFIPEKCNPQILDMILHAGGRGLPAQSHGLPGRPKIQGLQGALAVAVAMCQVEGAFSRRHIFAINFLIHCCTSCSHVD